mgnify:CR=1 FL=1
MSQSQRDRLAAVIRAWSNGSRLLDKLPDGSPDVDKGLVEVLLERLQGHTTMGALADAYTADGGRWPSDLPWPLGLERRSRERVVVAAAYWRRYQQLLVRAADLPPFAPSPGRKAVPQASRADLGQDFGLLEMVYTIKLWQRGPIRLRSLPPDRRARYEPLVDAIYRQVAGCRDVRELAAYYYGSGDWILQVARETLKPMGEPLSNMSWVQDAACWRRYQELLDGGASRGRSSGQPPTFAIWLASQMARRRTSVAELARRLGASEEAVRAWLHAAEVPSPEHCRALAAAFGLTESQMPRVGEIAR